MELYKPGSHRSSTQDRLKMSTSSFAVNRKDSLSYLKEKALLSKDSEINVGFSDLPNQIHRKTGKKGFEFTLMLVGESGLGKSTLVNSMFITDIYSEEFPGPSKRPHKTLRVETHKVLLKEKNVNLALTIVDTPGFGSSVDNSSCWKPITEYIEHRYEEYLNAENRVHRKHLPDNRVHCCLYFISPNGHCLRPIDIELMKNIHDKVNIIPIIAKSDTMTPEECTAFKKCVMADIAAHGIKIYEFPDCEDDSEAGKLQRQFKSKVPFAVVGSNYVLDVAGERKRGRKYPWGSVDIENLEHCDFVALKSMIIKYYMLDLVDTTNIVHYENYRSNKLSGINGDSGNGNGNGSAMEQNHKNPLAQMEEEKKEHDEKMKKMEQEMKQVFEMKVKEKWQRIKETEAGFKKRHEQAVQLLEDERAKLEERRAAFEKEKAAFELVRKDMEEIRRVNTMEVSAKEMLEKKKEKKKGLF